MKQRWLKDWPWETVVAINAGLCKEKGALHKPTSDGYQPAVNLWEASRQRELTHPGNAGCLPPVPPARALLLLQREHFRGHRPHADPGHAPQNVAGESSQFTVEDVEAANILRDKWFGISLDIRLKARPYIEHRLGNQEPGEKR